MNESHCLPWRDRALPCQRSRQMFFLEGYKLFEGFYNPLGWADCKAEFYLTIKEI